MEKVRAYFRQFNVENRILELPASSATVELAAKALGCEPAAVYLDCSLRRFEAVFPACGSSNSAIQLTIPE